MTACRCLDGLEYPAMAMGVPRGQERAILDDFQRDCPVHRKLRVLVACEFSRIVADAFDAAGHYAASCDLLPSERNGLHYQGDVRDILGEGWDLMIAHPPCTHLAVSGARWWPDKQKEQGEALEFVQELLDAPIPFIAIENPVSLISSRIAPPTQVIQPWQFGHGEQKAICLWLKGLPPLVPTNRVAGREQRVWKMPPSPDRWKERSRFFPGVAEAMAKQWPPFVRLTAAFQKSMLEVPFQQEVLPL